MGGRRGGRGEGGEGEEGGKDEKECRRVEVGCNIIVFDLADNTIMGCKKE